MLPKRNWFSSALKNPGESQWQVGVGIAGNRTYIYSVLISIKCTRSSVESYTLRSVFLFIFVFFFFYFVTRKFYASQGRDRVDRSISVEYYYFRVSWQITLDHGDLFHFVSCVFRVQTEAT